jgi:hypothetical protein
LKENSPSGTPLALGVVDKLAASVYLREFDVAVGHSNYVLTAYPRKSKQFNLKKVSPGENFWGIYRVSRW